MAASIVLASSWPSVVGFFGGITHFHHPEIATMLFRASPENRLLEIIDIVLFGGPLAIPGAGLDDPVEGTAREIQDRLFTGRTAFEAKSLLKYANSCGTYLGKLQASPETHHRICSRTVRGETVWTIQPPPVTVPEPVPIGEDGADTLPHPPPMPTMVS
jgi:hypothetical protein